MGNVERTPLLVLCVCLAFTVASPPEWLVTKNLIRIDVPEGYGGRIYIVSSKVTDPDGDTVTYKFSWTPTSGSDYYDFDDTGVLRVKSGVLLDKDAMPEVVHKIVITATDGTEDSVKDMEITLTVVANAPNITADSLDFTVDEGPAGQELIPDGGLSNVKYSFDKYGDSYLFRILPGTPYVDYFSIDSTTGMIKFAQDYYLDPSTSLPSTVTMQVQAYDRFDETDSVSVTFNVQNVNQVPTFDDLPKTVTVAEDITSGTTVFTVKATDKDTADTVTLSANFNSGQNKFDFDPTTGVVSLKAGQSLDYNKKTSYQITFTADDGQATSDAVLTIDVTDVNAAPSFNFYTFQITAPEGTKNYAFPDPGIKSKVTDEDGDTVTFSLLPGVNSDYFKVDANTAVISYAKDYEVDPNALPGSVVLNLQVSDPKGLNDNTTVTLTITNVNKAPVLENLANTTTVAEDLTGGSAIFTIQWSDPDSLDNPTLEYEFLDSQSVGLFDINKLTGLVSLRQGASLDYETKSSHRIKFVATDTNLNSTTKTLRVQVTDVNEAPSFSSSSYSVSTPEGPAGNSFPDSGLLSGSTDPESDSLTFSIISGDPDNRFSLDPTTAILSFNKDYEVDALALSGYESLTVKAADPDGLTATTILDVRVTDVNKAPTLTNLPTSVSVDESELGGSFITTITGADPDSGDTVTFGHSFTTASGAAIFDVDDNSGTITLKPTAVLDYESEKVYMISFTATDGEATSTPQVLTININNVNEAPVLSNNKFQISVNEGPAGTVLPDSGLQAASSDPENDSLTYSIVSGANRDKFTMDPNTGLVSFASDYEVDRANFDQPESVYLTVQAEDPAGLTTTASLDISITNVNKPPTVDNLPDTITIREDALGGSSVFTVDVADPDTGDVVTLQYTFNPSDGSAVFDTDANSGKIVLNANANLDYESRRQYTVTVMASDSSLSSSPKVLTIQIADVNEAPEFTQSVYPVTVVEGQAGSIVVPYLASSVTDPDTPDTKTFSLVQGANSDNFNIDSSTGRVTFAVDYDADPKRQPEKVTLYVQVEDKGQLKDIAAIDVDVTNVNKAPSITNLPGVVRIAEDLSPGSSVFQVAFEDLDSADVVTVHHTFIDSKSSGVFDVDTNGRITLKQDASLDYETDSYYRIQFIASDSNLNSTAAILEIFVTDVNEAPSFSQDFSTTVNEGPAGTALPFSGITTFSSDPERDDLQYDIVGGDHQDKFTMDPVTAELTFRQDYEVDSLGDPGFLQLTVRATDPGGLSARALLNVTILNVNKPPSITNLDADINVPENVLAGTTVFTVGVADADSSDTPTLIPRFTVGSPGDFFSVDDKTGEVTVKSTAQLDYETNTLYQIEFLVTDGQVTSSLPSTLTIHITNSNEVPVFNAASYSVTVPEGPAGSSVLSELLPFVSDLDAGDIQTFSIVQGSYSEYFDIDPEKGNISFAKSYNADPSSLPYNVQLTVKTTDTFDLTATTTVDVVITDVNQPPVITNLPNKVTIAANIASDTSVFTVEASDPDSTDTTTFGVTFPLSTVSQLFLVDSNTGEVRIQNGATFEYGDNPRTIVFTATDGTATSESAILTIEIGPAEEETAFLSRPENLGWFIPLMILLGLALLALTAFLIYRFCCTGSGYGGRRRIFDSENPRRLVRTPPKKIPPETNFEPKMKVKINKLQFPRIYRWVPQ